MYARPYLRYGRPRGLAFIEFVIFALVHGGRQRSIFFIWIYLGVFLRDFCRDGFGYIRSILSAVYLLIRITVRDVIFLELYKNYC